MIGLNFFTLKEIFLYLIMFNLLLKIISCTDVSPKVGGIKEM